MSELPVVRSRPRRLISSSGDASYDPIATANAKSSASSHGNYYRNKQNAGHDNSQQLSQQQLLQQKKGIKRRLATTANTVDEMFRVNTDSVIVQDELFKGMAFCLLGDEFVYSDSKSFSKSEVGSTGLGFRSFVNHANNN